MPAAAAPSRTAVRRLAVARAVSVTGTAASGVALAAALYARTGSATWVGAALLVGFAVPALVSPLSGGLSDRRDRRRLLIGSDLLGAACFAALALASAPGLLLALAFAAALAASPFLPASAAMLPALAGPGDLAWANGRLAAARNLGYVAGPLLGGALTGLAGAPWVFVLDALSFAASAGLIATLPAAARPGAAPAGRPRAAAGFRLLLTHPVLRALTLGYLMVDAGNGLMIPAELPLAHRFGTGAAGYGAMAAVWGAGGIAGAQIAPRLLRARAEPPVLAVAAAALGLALGLVAVAPWFAIALAGLVAGGAAMAVTGVGEDLLLARRVADAVRGRVYAAHLAVVQASLAVGLLGSGALVDTLGPQAVFGIAAGSVALGVLALARLLRPGS